MPIVVAIIPPFLQILSIVVGVPIDLGSLGQILTGIGGTAAVAHLAVSEPIQNTKYQDQAAKELKQQDNS